MKYLSINCPLIDITKIIIKQVLLARIIYEKLIENFSSEFLEIIQGWAAFLSG